MSQRVSYLWQLTTGRDVETPDGEQWSIASHATMTPQTPQRAKWLWLRRGNTYRKVQGTRNLLALRLVLLCLCLGLATSLWAACPPGLPCTPAQVSVAFSPPGGPTAAIVRLLNAAQQEVLVQAYSFTSAPIAQALVNAYKRGVLVQAVLDKSNQTDKYSAATFLAHAGIVPFIDAKHAIAHNKVMVIDGQTVITGSFNFTKAAEDKNAENLVVLTDAPEVAQTYATNIRAHMAHAKPYNLPGQLREERTGKCTGHPLNR